MCIKREGRVPGDITNCNKSRDKLLEAQVTTCLTSATNMSAVSDGCMDGLCNDSSSRSNVHSNHTTSPIDTPLFTRELEHMIQDSTLYSEKDVPWNAHTITTSVYTRDMNDDDTNNNEQISRRIHFSERLTCTQNTSNSVQDHNRINSQTFSRRCLTCHPRSQHPRHHKLLPLLFILLVGFTSVSDACAPRGRTVGPRRHRKLTPLVFKQHVPNVSENTLGASGITDGAIKRGDDRFKDLVRNNNPNILFRDEEGTGADRIMSQRCRDKLDTLAISVMNQWPGVNLRVTEAWDEDGLHAANSLHYEGRAVDITTSDKDRSKYGMLARLAVEAGFDWVYYETRGHVHCSVKSDSSVAINFGGCFPTDSFVITPGGATKSMSEVKVGDNVLANDPESGQLVYSDVVAFLDRNIAREAVFYTVKTHSGRAVTLTGKHLIYYATADDIESRHNENEENELRSQQSHACSEKEDVCSRFTTEDVAGGHIYMMQISTNRLAYADELEVGQYLLQASGLEFAQHTENAITSNVNSHMAADKIVSIEISRRKGVVAPLTAHGTVVVDGYVISCYAFLKDVNLAHSVFAPIRGYHAIKTLLSDWFSDVVQPATKVLQQWVCDTLASPQSTHSAAPEVNATFSGDDNNNTSEQEGAHWYARFLYSIAINVLGMDIFISI